MGRIDTLLKHDLLLAPPYPCRAEKSCSLVILVRTSCPIPKPIAGSVGTPGIPVSKCLSKNTHIGCHAFCLKLMVTSTVELKI